MKVFILCALVALSCAQTFDLQATFNLADTNGDGSISHAELDALFATFDDDSNSLVSAQEFVVHFTKTGLSSDASLYLFYRVDANSDESIDKAETDALFNTFDVDNSQGVSYDEFAAVMNGLLGQVKIAGAGEASVDALIDAADTDKNGEMTGDEMWSILSGADSDGDKLVSEKEFTTFWMAKTGDNQDRSMRLFKKIETKPNTAFGSDTEKSTLFSSFDYDKSGTVSKDEFKNALLYLFAAVNRDISKESISSAMSPNFDAQKAFDRADADKNGHITKEEVMAGFAMADMNGDKSLNATEFITMRMMSNMSQIASVYSMFSYDHNNDQMVSEDEFKMGVHHKDRNMDMKLSFDEFKQAADMILMKVHRAALVDDKLNTKFDLVDANGDEMLTSDEMSNIFKPADTNGDGLSKKEFVAYWPLHTGLSEMFSSHQFDIFDTDMDGKINDAERAAMFNAFDWEKKDGMLTKKEFGYAMLRVFVDTIRDITMYIEGKLKGNFNGTLAFDMADFDHDGAIQKQEYIKGYNMTDADGDGIITPSEFVAADMRTGISREGALYIFFRLDSNKDLKLTFTEVDGNFGKLDMDDDDEVSREEYMSAIKMLKHQLSEASMAGFKTSKMYDMADMDKSGNLTRAEMTSIFVAADDNKDGLVSEAEFKNFWMAKTMEPAERTEILFGILDSDNDGQFGDDLERQALFDGFDYNDDDLVTKVEFQDSLLNLFARVMEQVEERIDVAKAADTVIGYFY